MGSNDESNEAPLTPRPLSRHFHFDELDRLEEMLARGESITELTGVTACSATSAVQDIVDVGEDSRSTLACATDSHMDSATDSHVRPKSLELDEKLAHRRSQLEANAQVFESSPLQSSADASHLEGLVFGAQPVNEWLQKHKCPEDDRAADLLAEGLQKRGTAPAHAPRATAEEDTRRIEELREHVAQLQEQLLAEQENICEAKDALLKREAALRHQEEALELERKEQQQRRVSQQDYPRPHFLAKCEGTMNIGVVGNSGVGKSLLINKLRNLHPGAEGWAPVGVKETTLTVSMYAFPNERRVRLWDFPGAGTQAFPLETYISRMGLRYLDRVVIVTAGRFTETEIALKEELEKYSVPYCMVRTKADIDIWNNQIDNKLGEFATLTQIRDDLVRNRGLGKPYVVSLRDPDKYDFPRLYLDIFPCLDCESFGDGWDDAWAMPEAYSTAVLGIQGRWIDQHGTYFFVQGMQVHVAVANGGAAEVTISEHDGQIWWLGRWCIDDVSTYKARCCSELHWSPYDTKIAKPMVWRWCDY